MPRLTTRDYKRPSRGSGASKLREFGLGVLVGAVLASAAFLLVGARTRHGAVGSAHARSAPGPHAAAPEASSSDGSGAASPSASSGSASTAQAAASASAGAQAPQYDFYRMLPRLNVPVPHEDGQPAHAPSPAASPPARGTGPSYVLQVGSYRSSAEAYEVRARLARAGIAAQVERVAAGSRTWNRVRIGPLSDTELAKVRAQLRTANIHALVIRADR